MLELTLFGSYSDRFKVADFFGVHKLFTVADLFQVRLESFGYTVNGSGASQPDKSGYNKEKSSCAPSHHP